MNVLMEHLPRQQRGRVERIRHVSLFIDQSLTEYLITHTAGGIKFDRRILRAFEARTCFCRPALCLSKMQLTWQRSVPTECKSLP